MNITVKARPESKKVFVKQITVTSFEVAVSEPPVDGRANHAIQVAIAKYLGIKRSDVQLIQGSANREKVFSTPLSPEQLEMIYKVKNPQEKLL